MKNFEKFEHAPMTFDQHFTLEVQHRLIYGRHLTYPANEQARRACALLGKKTLSAEDLTGLEALGFVISWVPQGEAAE